MTSRESSLSSWYIDPFELDDERIVVLSWPNGRASRPEASGAHYNLHGQRALYKPSALLSEHTGIMPTPVILQSGIISRSSSRYSRL